MEIWFIDSTKSLENITSLIFYFWKMITKFKKEENNLYIRRQTVCLIVLTQIWLIAVPHSLVTRRWFSIRLNDGFSFCLWLTVLISSYDN